MLMYEPSSFVPGINPQDLLAGITMRPSVVTGKKELGETH